METVDLIPGRIQGEMLPQDETRPLATAKAVTDENMLEVVDNSSDVGELMQGMDASGVLVVEWDSPAEHERESAALAKGTFVHTNDGWSIPYQDSNKPRPPGSVTELGRVADVHAALPAALGKLTEHPEWSANQYVDALRETSLDQGELLSIRLKHLYYYYINCPARDIAASLDDFHATLLEGMPARQQVSQTPGHGVLTFHSRVWHRLCLPDESRLLRDGQSFHNDESKEPSIIAVYIQHDGGRFRRALKCGK